MAIDKQEVHRPGALKQTNKPHKTGRHRSKGSISLSSKGRVSVKIASRKSKRELNREDRRHQANQIRQKKRDEVLAKKRGIGGLNSAPFLVGVIPLQKDIYALQTLTLLGQCDPEATVTKSELGITHINIPRFKQRFSFVVPDLENEFATLDALKICDTVLFLVSAANCSGLGHDPIDTFGQNILNLIFAQGLPTPIVAVTDLASVNPKKRNEVKQNIQKAVCKILPDDKVVPLDLESDAINIFRKIGSQKKRAIFHRDRRPHMIAEKVVFTPNETGSDGILKITGFLRGATLCVNDLVHIPGLGDFQMAQITAPSDDFGPEKDRSSGSEERIIAISDPEKRESLISENIPDPLDAEQTWPTEEEIQMAQDEQKKKKVKKVPKGWSDYQACWIPDLDAEDAAEDTEAGAAEGDDGDDSSSEDDGMEFEDAVSEEHSSAGEDSAADDDDFKSVTESEVGVSDEKYDQATDLVAEAEELAKLKLAKADSMFPDEVDTPQDVAARQRFQRYRGLESFRTSPWDPKENLPQDYARIFQFRNFDRTRRRIVRLQEEKEGAEPGWLISVHVAGVPAALWRSFSPSSSLVMVGLYANEHKMCLVNAVLRRTANYAGPIASKERLVVQCGHRRFLVHPIFSQHTNGSKHKYERFFQPASQNAVVASFYAPIQFPPAPVVCFKEVGSNLVPVAVGSLMSCDPDRIVVKRIVLSGHPMKIHKKSAVVRFMFFNREDIAYFKPCKLRTKMGRVGHIKEPLGTHGHMKCVFDGQLKSQDTVLLSLYKRVFPKWTYEECLAKPASDMCVD